jgi:hypothetical protein
MMRGQEGIYFIGFFMFLIVLSVSFIMTYENGRSNEKIIEYKYYDDYMNYSKVKLNASQPPECDLDGWNVLTNTVPCVANYFGFAVGLGTMLPNTPVINTFISVMFVVFMVFMVKVFVRG